ncbi:MAG: monooxygenase [Microbacteriaceae bacterium]|nr:monooxygenase [Microbacteriaceae bacterium]
MAGLDESLVDVLIVGAGPTGLALAAALNANGVSFRIVDKAPDAVHESRALGIQARTLEVLSPLEVTPHLVEAGDSAVSLSMHFAKGTFGLRLFESGVDETAYPFLLFLSQARTEEILIERLETVGVSVERGVELSTVERGAEFVQSFLLAGASGLTVRSRFVVGCDGAHSSVRHAARIGFVGGSFDQTFLIADLEADNLEHGRVHVFLAEEGVMLFFPLGSPATWRVLAMVPAGERVEHPTVQTVQATIGRYTTDPITVRDPVWLTTFSVQSRLADRFRAGRVFLAGDAAHIHSPAGAQGMNTGIQDAVNLGWKLGLVCRGQASDVLLDSYELERLPVARSVIRTTNRAFRVAISRRPLTAFVRSRVVSRVVPVVLRIPLVRKIGFRLISQLSIRYRNSPLSVEGTPRLGRGPRSGNRVPDSPIIVAGRPTTVHRSLSPSAFQLLCFGPLESWAGHESVDAPWSNLIRVAMVGSDAAPGVWTDPTRSVQRRFGLRGSDVAHFLIRPDGYIGYRARGSDLGGVNAYLRSL